MDKALTELSNRIGNLELLLNHTNQNHSKLFQVESLKQQLATVYKEHPELVKFNQILTDLKLWDALKKQDSSEEDVSREMKQEFIVFNYSTLKEITSNLAELSSLNSTTVIDKLNTDIQTTDISSSKLLLSTYKDDIFRINELMTMLIMKNMIVYEEYVQLMIKENKKWLQFEEMLSQLESKINHIETIQAQKNKY
ncbi:uncharacterized protein SPAPADRAFT_153747 [Spathaspora passalidarum NRRL Y-27907]|uniref:Uncharacterized protein n=1 Tax=Spathaspora passalidarum (strain NRRL Y-27907 / 11-Y1) TaxID=619300 RepID=G3ANY3_SPAPN|nr:uncharacterized protein SPAPADRAFT_153747 [Spathaspora passalidarum NRRL Y-27907]EGW32608.1 hypothetical protein SPAPADRAFT_153747 [Spathaspora passalidarum NRRL Y-27907]